MQNDGTDLGLAEECSPGFEFAEMDMGAGLLPDLVNMLQEMT